MHRPHLPRTAALRRHRPLVATAGLIAVIAGVMVARPAVGADYLGRLFTVAGHVEIHDINDHKDCTKAFADNDILKDNSEYNRDKERSFTFRRVCGNTIAEVYVIGKLQSNNYIETSGWVRVSESKTQLAYKPHAAGFAPNFEQHAGPVTFGDPQRGMVTFEWVMRNEDGWGF
jgi:hypothetical protein